MHGRYDIKRDPLYIHSGGTKKLSLESYQRFLAGWVSDILALDVVEQRDPNSKGKHDIKYSPH